MPLTRQINSIWSDEEYEHLLALANTRGITISMLVRTLVQDALKHELSTGEQAILMAIRELQMIHVSVLEASLRKELSTSKLGEIVRDVRSKRRDLMVGFMEEIG